MVQLDKAQRGRQRENHCMERPHSKCIETSVGVELVKSEMQMCFRLTTWNWEQRNSLYDIKCPTADSAISVTGNTGKLSEGFRDGNKGLTSIALRWVSHHVVVVLMSVYVRVFTSFVEICPALVVVLSVTIERHEENGSSFAIENISSVHSFPGTDKLEGEKIWNHLDHKAVMETQMKIAHKGVAGDAGSM